MSWKEKRLITVLCAILAVLFAAVVLVLSMRYRAAKSAKEAAGDDPGAAMAQTAQSPYVALHYDNGASSLSFAQGEDGTWYWESEPDFPLNDENISAILELLVALRPQQTLERPEDLSDCGLDAPRASLTATAPDGAVLSVSMGNATTDGESCYADINHDPEHIYIIPGALYQALQTPIYDMCVLPQLPEMPQELLDSILIQGPRVSQEAAEDGEDAIVRTTTVLTATRLDGGVSWRSGGANVTDAPALRALLEDLQALEVESCVDYRPSEEGAAFCGFDDPVTLTVHYRTAAGAEETFIMNVGTQNMDGSGRYVRFGEEDAIYLMRLELLDPLMRLAYQGMENPA